MIERIRRSVPLLAGLLVVAVALQLGQWQTRRAAEKLALQARMETFAASAPIAPRADAAALAEWQPLRLSGTWHSGATRLIDNRTHQGRAGYHVVTPLVLADGSGAVLVNRGWLAAGDRRSVPEVAAPAGVQRVDGWLRLPQADPFMLAADAGDPSAPVWQHPDPLRHARLVAPNHLAQWIVYQTSAADDGLVREWPLPAAGVDRHRGYAFQWYALACLAAGLSVWAGWRLFLRSDHDDRNARLIRG